VLQRYLINRNRIAALAASALLFAACSSAGTGATATPGTAATQPPASTAATTPPSAGASQGAEAYEVELGDNDKLGKFLTGEDGKTLYLFTPDTATTSACNTGCVDSWPPFTLDAGETVKGGEGVTGKFGTITRQDGATQVTYNSHPLYYFSGDQAAGDTNGQGLNSKWYVVGADGNAIMAKAQASGGKYGY
jgi:predicted lipoprotein with Yx(FWY)xxD motif